MNIANEHEVHDLGANKGKVANQHHAFQRLHACFEGVEKAKNKVSTDSNSRERSKRNKRRTTCEQRKRLEELNRKTTMHIETRRLQPLRKICLSLKRNRR